VGDLIDALVQQPFVEDFVDQSDAARLLCGDAPRGEQQVGGLRKADGADQRSNSGCVVTQAEEGIIRRIAKIGGQCDRGAAADAESVDGCEQRLLEPL
jgi:hypothetical protein